MATVVNDRDVLIMGPGERYTAPSGSALLIAPSAPAFTVAASGTPTPSSITFNAVRVNVTGTATFSASDGATLTVNGDEATLTYANMPNASATVTASVTEGGTVYSRSVTVSKVFESGTTFTWLKYADDAAGTGLSDSPVGKTYIGFATNKSTATESTNPADYTWSLIKGGDGLPGPAGADGQTTYMWVKYSDYADGTNLYDVPNDDTIYIGIATNKLTATESTVKTDYVWSRFKGAQGVPGTGARGPGWFYATGSAWNDTTAHAATPGDTQVDDTVTISDGNVSYTKRWNGSSWFVPGAFMDGSLFVEKSITAAKINANGLEIRDSQGNLILGAGSALRVPDTRSVNTPPSGYDVGHIKEFKERAVVGLGVGGYCVVETIKGYHDNSGGDAMQWAYIGASEVWKRSGGNSDSAWGPWVRDLDRNLYTGDLNATSDLVLVGRGVAINGNTLTRTQTGSGWGQADCYSKDSYTGGAFVTGVLTDNSAGVMIGLNNSVDGDNDAHYNTINYAIYGAQAPGGAIEIYEHGSYVATGATWAAGDVLGVFYNGSNVLYTKNGVELRKVSASAGLTLFFDSSFISEGRNITNVRFGPLSDISAGVAANAAIPGLNAAISDKLSKSAASVLNATIALQTGSAILAGDTTNGVYMHQTGLVGVQGGVVKFSVPTSGDPTFAGQLTAAYGTFGAVSIASGGSFSSGQSAYDTGSGWWMGYVGGVPKFSIGTTEGGALLWDGTDLIARKIKFDALSATISGTLLTSVESGPADYGSLTVAASGGTVQSYDWSITFTSATGVTTSYGLSAGAGTDTASFRGSATNMQIQARITCLVTFSDGRTTSVSRNHNVTHGTYQA